MKILYQKKFLKDLAQIPAPYRKKIEHFVFKDLTALNNFHELKNAEKMSGYPNHYKIRFGEYRLGFHFENNVMTLERLLHRKEIYRYFP